MNNRKTKIQNSISSLVSRIKVSGGVIIAGTGTSVGKSLVTKLICIQLNKRGIGSCPFKPYESGKNSDIKSIIEDLELCNIKFTRAEISKFNIYNFKEGLSPHLASKRKGISIDLKRIIRTYKSLKKAFQSIVFEPAGGLLVPINERTLQIALLKKLKLPVLLVASPKLGTINHTLLSIKCLEENRLKILGIIFCNGENMENKEAIEKFCKYKVLLSIPHFKTKKARLRYLSSEKL